MNLFSILFLITVFLTSCSHKSVDRDVAQTHLTPEENGLSLSEDIEQTQKKYRALQAVISKSEKSNTPLTMADVAQPALFYGGLALEGGAAFLTVDAIRDAIKAKVARIDSLNEPKQPGKFQYKNEFNINARNADLHAMQARNNARFAVGAGVLGLIMLGVSNYLDTGKTKLSDIKLSKKYVADLKQTVVSDLNTLKALSSNIKEIHSPETTGAAN